MMGLSPVDGIQVTLGHFMGGSERYSSRASWNGRDLLGSVVFYGKSMINGRSHYNAKLDG
jgi:hypothetical protein